MKFASKNKALVRLIDSKYISMVAKKKKLGYFGLPGPNAFDIEIWREYIEYIHAVEWDKEKVAKLDLKLMELDFSFNKALFIGDICDIINDEFLKQFFKKYQLINLDFTGVLVSSTSDLKKNAKLNAIERLIKLQSDKFENMEEMVLLVTFYGARNDSKDLDDALDNLLEGLTKFNSLKNSNIEEICDWIKIEGKQYHKIMIIFPVWLFTKCSNFLIECAEIIYYKGDSNSPMVHFVFKLIKTQSAIDFSSLINIQKIESIPLQKIKIIEEGTIKISNLGIPEFKVNI